MRLKRAPFVFLMLGMLGIFGRLAFLLVTKWPLEHNDWVVRGGLGGLGALGAAAALYGLGLEAWWAWRDAHR